MEISDLEIITYHIVDDDFSPVELTQRRGLESVKWTILQGGACFNKQGKWEYEPMPSSRTDEFIERTRWNSAQEALDFWVRAEGRSRFQ